MFILLNMSASNGSNEREINEYQDESMVVMRVVVRVILVVTVIAVPKTSIIRLGFLVFP